MKKTKIEYADFTSNPVFARQKGSLQKIGTFCEKPDQNGTCRNCWAESLNLRFGNGLTFDKKNRHLIEWVFRENELKQLVALNAKKPRSEKFPGAPALVFCADTFDLFQPSVTDPIRDRIFDLYDTLENLILLIQTTYPAKMNRYFRQRYPESLPAHYWIGISAGTQSFLNQHLTHLFEVRALVRYVIFEPLLEEIVLNSAFRHHYAKLPLSEPAQLQKLEWVIIGGESGNKARKCEIDWIRSLVRQRKMIHQPVFVKQLGKQPGKSVKGNDLDLFPSDLKIREFPEEQNNGNHLPI